MDEEQANTANQEIEVARRSLAKLVNKALEDGIGDLALNRLTILSQVIDRIR